MMSEISLILELILKLLPIIKPSDLEKIKSEISKLEEQREKDKQNALAAIKIGDMPALNRIIVRLLDL